MKSLLRFGLAVATAMFSMSAWCSAGEYWEVTSKMEMQGMPFAMPSTTHKVCVPKGSESDPNTSTGDKGCKMSDVKKNGNKTTWKARCDHDGKIMTGIGEQTTNANGYTGKMQFSGDGMNMSMTYSGKRLGGSCK